jgi:hypothetical protein
MKDLKNSSIEQNINKILNSLEWSSGF